MAPDATEVDLRIARIEASEALDSRGRPTIAVEGTLADRTVGQAMVPPGASSGVNETLELRAGDKKRLAAKVLFDAIVLTPQEEQLRIELQGNLAAMLKVAQAQSTVASMVPLGRWEDERSLSDDDVVQKMLIAGARNPLNLELPWQSQSFLQQVDQP